MNADMVSMSQASFFDALREAQAYAWDAAVANMVYEDGTKVELMTNDNPYRKERR